MLSITDIPVKTQVKFWGYANIASPIECWEWRRSKTPLGYGKMNIRGRVTYAHRVSYVLTKSPIPDGMCVCHMCDNPSCINPFHLFLGTKKDNTRDMILKKRHPLPSFRDPESKDRPKFPLRGTAKKLTIAQVVEIRATFKPKDNVRALAEKYQVTTKTIYDIVYKRLWRWLEDER
jgi:hypothetical protein